jgi:SpoVK/Ycf46/Vps4 family AAA+-type ATPase
MSTTTTMTLMMAVLLVLSMTGWVQGSSEESNQDTSNSKNADDVEFITNDDVTISDAVRTALLNALKMKLAEKASQNANQQQQGGSTVYGGTTTVTPTTNPTSDPIAPVISQITGCDIVDPPDPLHTVNCKLAGGQWITIKGRHFGDAGAVVSLFNHHVGGDVLVCGFPRHWVSNPTQVMECRLPYATANTVFDVVLRTNDGRQSDRVIKAVSYKRIVESPLPDFTDFESLGIGGLEKELTELKRKVFASRKGSNAHLLSKLGIRPVRGVLLYGPPGTGKTLVARKIAEVLQAKSVKVVNGPEIMSKYVGESEANMRGLFSAAEQDFKANHERAGLHVIVLDEMDAMLRHRGVGDDSAARAVYDGVTTQLLALMDGFQSLPNILLIGLTNRIQGIDKALLRPGRFEIKLRLPVPDEGARYQILRVHTKSLRENAVLSTDVDLQAIAKMTTGFTGADLEGTVRAAISHAMERGENDLFVIPADVHAAVRDMYASNKVDSHAVAHMTRGIISYSPAFLQMVETFKRHVTHLNNSPHTRVLKLLLEGKEGCGLTALASYFASLSEFPYVKFITAASVLGKRPEEKLAAVVAAMDDVLDVPIGVVVIDTLEQFVEYNPLGTRVNSYLLHELNVLLTRTPPRGHGNNKGKLMILMTSHNPEALKTLEFSQSTFDTTLSVPLLTKADQFRFLKAMKVFASDAITMEAVVRTPALMPIKKLVFLLDAVSDQYEAPSTGDDLAAGYLPVRTRDGDAQPHITLEAFQAVQKEFGFYVDDVAGATSAKATFLA